jgi:hypothetical protein
VLARLDDLGFEVLRFEARSTWPRAFERLARVLGRTGMTQTAAFSPGTLVTARGREWMVLAGSTADTLRVRPISGSEEDQTLIYLPLEPQGVREARFPVPDVKQLGGHDAALLLRDALLLSMRRGAGPFRSFGQIAVEPRAYQLVPLLMALKLDPVRLLIADDVGVGKTIEAALILREMLDRGDIERSVVLCPPHLVEQWVTELEARFNLQAVAVTASSAKRLERAIPPGVSLFQVHPHTVVSLDYIKSQERRAHFLHHCPTSSSSTRRTPASATARAATSATTSSRALADSADRHLVLLTATPHSGDDAAFYRLLGLLDRSFEQLQEPPPARSATGCGSASATTSSSAVASTSPSGASPGSSPSARPASSPTSSPASGRPSSTPCSTTAPRSSPATRATPRPAAQLLGHPRAPALRGVEPDGRRARAPHPRGRGLSPDERAELLDRLFDGDADASWTTTSSPRGHRRPRARRARGPGREASPGRRATPSSRSRATHVVELLNGKEHATSPSSSAATSPPRTTSASTSSQRSFPDVTVEVITGELPSEEREARVARSATSRGGACSSPPTASPKASTSRTTSTRSSTTTSRGTPRATSSARAASIASARPAPVVRATLMYGVNNPVDGAVLEVILRKAERIRKELGVPVPCPTRGTRSRRRC